ncbi:MAG: hypothetical protein OSJ43_06690 [Oscillospiraceae bacterium]|nr:hypothetical protein [Oscillospiraceae bacterium]
MASKEILEAVLRDTGTSKAAAASKIGWLPQTLSNKLRMKTMRADEFLELMEALGVSITYTLKETGTAVRVRIPGAGRKVRKMVDGIIYDTAAASAISNNFYSDGVNEYTDGMARELYKDSDNRFFFAEYSSLEGVNDRIIPITANDAADFIKKYGTEINKKPANV